MGGADRVKHTTKYRRARKFYGNRYAAKKDPKSCSLSEDTNDKVQPMQIQKNGDTLSANSSTNTLASNSSVSYRKIIPIEVSTPKKNYSNIYGNRIIDVEILSDIFQLLCCPTCHLPQLKLGENISKKKGLASLLYLECVCGYSSEFYTSKTCGKGFDINGRAVYSMRACGQGHAGFLHDESSETNDTQ